MTEYYFPTNERRLRDTRLLEIAKMIADKEEAYLRLFLERAKIEFDLKRESDEGFPSIYIESTANIQRYYYNDGSPDGLYIGGTELVINEDGVKLIEVFDEK